MRKDDSLTTDKAVDTWKEGLDAKEKCGMDVRHQRKLILGKPKFRLKMMTQFLSEVVITLIQSVLDKEPLDATPFWRQFWEVTWIYLNSQATIFYAAFRFPCFPTAGAPNIDGSL